MEMHIQIERQIYLNVIEKLKKEKVTGEGNTYGLCYLVKNEATEIFGVTWQRYQDFGGNKRFCPTFLTRKPKKATYNQYWWELTDIDSRIACMESCIRELERGKKLTFFERLFRKFP